jgi:hypothetical protein
MAFPATRSVSHPKSPVRSLRVPRCPRDLWVDRAVRPPPHPRPGSARLRPRALRRHGAGRPRPSRLPEPLDLVTSRIVPAVEQNHLRKTRRRHCAVALRPKRMVCSPQASREGRRPEYQPRGGLDASESRGRLAAPGESRVDVEATPRSTEIRPPRIPALGRPGCEGVDHVADGRRITA